MTTATRTAARPCRKPNCRAPHAWQRPHGRRRRINYCPGPTLAGLLARRPELRGVGISDVLEGRWSA